MSESPAAADWLAVLRESQQQLGAIVTPLSAAEVAGPSYASEWSIAQVLSHLGSGAEIFTLFLDAGLNGAQAPGFEAFQPIWDEWNAKSSADQARDGLSADAAFVERLTDLDDPQVEGWRLEMFGGEQRLADVIRLRLGEHAVHTWDVAVALDPAATVRADAVDLLIDNLHQLVSRAGKAPEEPIAIEVTTEEPARKFRLEADGTAISLTSSDADSADADATLELPAEALIRLVYGRLDPGHTPEVAATGTDLDTLRQMFPGV
jgi:uncharacterized protein (TIGR03083 family)